VIRPGRPARSFDLQQDLTTLFVCAVATVVLTRGFLAATGYPQVGGSKLHIAHVLWGGLFMLAALVTALGFLSPAAKPLAAVAGGVGFGLFIDEVGKFVTKDVDYFYRPAIAIIYVCFVVLWLVIRWLARRNFTATEATLIGLESLQRAAVGGLSDERRAHVLALLRQTGAGGLAREVQKLLEGSTADATDVQPVGRRVSRRVGELWVRLTAHRLFRLGVFAVILAAALISLLETAWLLRHGVSHLSFSQRAFGLTTITADALLAVGLVALSQSVLAALHWYDRAVVLEITVGQVFLYGSEQLAASLDLIGLLALWALIRWAIEFENGRAALGAA
jgi:hypothetical protein